MLLTAHFSFVTYHFSLITFHLNIPLGGLGGFRSVGFSARSDLQSDHYKYEHL